MASLSIALFCLQSPRWWSHPSRTCVRAWGAASPCAAPCWRAAPWKWPPPSGASTGPFWRSRWPSSRTTQSWRWTASAGRPAAAMSAAFPTTWGSPSASSRCLVSHRVHIGVSCWMGSRRGEACSRKLVPVQAAPTASPEHSAVLRTDKFP